jgi:hypothetical protein
LVGGLAEDAGQLQFAFESGERDFAESGFLADVAIAVGGGGLGANVGEFVIRRAGGWFAHETFGINEHTLRELFHSTNSTVCFPTGLGISGGALDEVDEGLEVGHGGTTRRSGATDGRSEAGLTTDEATIAKGVPHAGADLIVANSAPGVGEAAPSTGTSLSGGQLCHEGVVLTADLCKGTGGAEFTGFNVSGDFTSDVVGGGVGFSGSSKVSPTGTAEC